MTDTIVAVALKPRPRTTVGALARPALLGHVVAPRLMERIGAYNARRHVSRIPPVPVSDGNLFAPMEKGRGVHGGIRTPAPLWASPVMMAGVAVAAAVAYSSLRRRH